MSELARFDPRQAAIVESRFFGGSTWDSLADAFFHSGDVSQAVYNYQEALATEGAYANADFAKKFILEHAQK